MKAIGHADPDGISERKAALYEGIAQAMGANDGVVVKAFTHVLNDPRYKPYLGDRAVEEAFDWVRDRMLDGYPLFQAMQQRGRDVIVEKKGKNLSAAMEDRGYIFWRDEIEAVQRAESSGARMDRVFLDLAQRLRESKLSS